MVNISGVARRLLVAILALSAAAAHTEPAVITLRGSLDNAEQSCLWIPAESSSKRPLLVMLHPWSSNFDGYDLGDWQKEAAARDWHYIQPDFRGPNNRPEACASPEARQDILDAVDHVVKHFAVDTDHVYLAGGSGGGHMALVMAAHAAERWAAVSAWVPITDLAAWHAETKAADLKYYSDLEKVCGDPPGGGDEIDACYRARSPLFILDKARNLPIDLNAGIHDGHKGSVPVHHTLDAFNVLARARGDEMISQDTIDALSRAEANPNAEIDPTYNRAIHLRRKTGPSRVTIFEGGHEGIAVAGCAWLEKH